MAPSQETSDGMSSNKPHPDKEAATDISGHANLHFWQRLAASSIGGVLTSITMTPFDVVKIRMQAQAKPQQFTVGRCFLYCNGLMDHVCMCEAENSKQVPWYRKPGYAKFSSPLDAAVKIVRHEGPQSLYSGLSATLVMAIPTTVIYFTTLDLLKARLGYPPPQGTESKAWVPPVAAIGARLVSVLFVSPVELIRTSMQAQRMSWSSVVSSLAADIRANGPLTMWRGVVPSLLRDVPFSAIYWFVFDAVKMARLRAAGTHALSLGEAAGIGGMAGLVAGVVTLPFDVVKTHQQMELGAMNRSESVSSSMRKLVSNSGGRHALFTGLVPRLLKVVPACAIMVGSFEYLKSYFSEANRTQAAAAAGGGGHGGSTS